MKNKKAVYFLLPVVLLIWSAIFYRIYTSTSGETGSSYHSAALPGEIYELPEEKEYTLILDYPDPFLSSLATRKFSSTKEEVGSSKTEIPVQHQPPGQVGYNWEGVRYLGTIEHSKKKTRIALVEVQGKNYMLSKRVPQDGIELISLKKDSVEIRIGPEKRYIKLQNAH